MRWPVLLAVWMAVPGAFAQGTLCGRLRALTEEASVASAHWGVSVTTLDGTPLCAIHENQLFRPASNNKLFTTAAAFAGLGPDSTVETRVLGVFDAASGTVTGNLTLKGGADANLDSGDLPYVVPSQRGAARTFAFHDLQALAAQLAAQGVKNVTGDVVGDDTLFPYEPYAPSWNADDLVWGYGAPVSALSIADNQLRLTISPGTAGGAATVTLDQHGIPYYTVQAQVETRAKGTQAGIGIGVERERVGTRGLRVYGAVAEGAPDVEEIAIDEPALYAAMAFRAMLAEQGITVAGVARAEHRLVRDAGSFLTEVRAAKGSEAALANGQTAAACADDASTPVLAVLGSARLAEDATFTQKTSQNLHAELMLHRLGRRAVCGGGSGVDGARTVRAFLLQAGVASDDMVLYDGSGLSDHDLVTPRSLTHLLTYAVTQPWFDAWKATLPVSGMDGSLASRFAGPLKGRVQAKTGTLGESRALSGYVTTGGGKTLAFSILVDTHLPGSADRMVMDRMVEMVAAER